MSMSAGRSVFDLLAKAGLPLAEGSWYESVQHRFLFGEPELIRGLFTAALAMGLVLLVIGMSYRWQKRRQQPAPTQPMALFRRVLSKMGLTVIERWLLWRLARNSGLEHPTALLISSRLYDGAVDRYCAGSGLFFARAGKAASFAAIRRRIFGEKNG
ncbi:MAG TPA: hypothetical protein PLL20_14025 [Phycisphaerae bacterium]|nr:hypothetical protein [Phycisphaerae bacterium]HRR83960.1 hypothetical protein [Phycisphaerae bacterium]